VSYQSTVVRIREDTERKVLGAWRAYGLGRITRPQFVQLAASFVVQGNSAATATADLALAAELSRASGDPYPPTGLPAAYDQPRLERSLAVILADTDADPTARLARFASSEPLQAATDAYSKGVSGSYMVEGWVRQLDGDPCQLCRWWWREGHVWPKSHRMAHHTGCSCTQRVVMVEKQRKASR
jgi:hypothetical protein